MSRTALSRLSVNLEANSAQFRQELQRSKGEARTWSVDISKYAKAGAAALVAGGAAAAASIIAVTKASAAQAAAMADHADMIGINTKALGGLRHAADTMGSSSEAMDASIQRFVRRLAQARDGTGAAVGGLRELGLEAEKLGRMTPEQAMHAVADAMVEVEDQGRRTQIAFDLFGREGISLVNTLASGSEGLRAAAEDADRLGLSISRVDAAKLAAVNDAGERAGRVMKGLGNTVAIEVAPVITGLSNEFFAALESSDGFKTAVVNGMQVVVEVVAYAANGIRGLQVVWKLVEVAAHATVEATLRSLAALDRGLAAVGDSIPFLEVKPTPAIQQWAADATARTLEAQAALHELAMQPMPHAEVKAWFDRVKAEAQAAAEAVADAAPQRAFIDPRQIEDDIEANRQLSQRAIEEEQKRLESIRQGTQTQQQLMAERYAQNMEFVINAETLQAEERTELLVALAESESVRLLEIDKKRTDDERRETERRIQLAEQERAAKFSVYSGMFGNLSSLMSSGSRRMFEIGKKAAIAAAVVSGIEAGVHSYKAGAKIGGPVLGAAFAATSAIATGVQIENLRNQQFGGGGAVGGMTGGASEVPMPDVPAWNNDMAEQQQGRMEIHVHGNIYGDAIDQLASELADKINNSDYVMIEGSSLQAQALMG